MDEAVAKLELVVVFERATNTSVFCKNNQIENAATNTREL